MSAAAAITVLCACVFGASALVAQAPNARIIAIHNIHTKDTVTVVYKRDGRYQSDAMAKLNWVMRDWRRGEQTTIDPELIDILWEIHTELGSQKPIHLISGYRSEKTNSMLQNTRGGQASKSRHILGKAADVHFPDIPVRQLRYSAMVRERGGVGYYPTSAIPFVHVDTSRVRHWPRMSRPELALLFPDGRTKHRPKSGGPVTRTDAIQARKQHTRLAAQVAEYRDTRGQPRGATRLALAEPPLPAARPIQAPRPERAARAARTPQPTPRPNTQLAALDAGPAAPERTARPAPHLAPQLVASPALAPRPSAHDRSRLTDLFTLAAFMPNPAPTPAPVARPSANASAAQSNATAQPAALRTASASPDWGMPDVSWLTGRKTQPAPSAVDRAAQTHDDRQTSKSGGAANRFAYVGDRGIAPTGGSDFAEDLAADVDAQAPSQWIAAAAYDEEHPDELSYRPFPVAPLLAASASPDDPILAQMTAPDPERTLDYLTATDEAPPMRFLPAQYAARAMWAQEFKGAAINTDALDIAPEPRRTANAALTQRRVQTSAR